MCSPLFVLLFPFSYAPQLIWVVQVCWIFRTSVHCTQDDANELIRLWFRYKVGGFFFTMLCSYLLCICCFACICTFLFRQVVFRDLLKNWNERRLWNQAKRMHITRIRGERSFLGVLLFISVGMMMMIGGSMLFDCTWAFISSFT